MTPSALSPAGKIGLPPGTLVHVGEPTTGAVSIQIMDFDAAHLEERSVARPEELAPYLDRDTVTWINVTGVHDLDVVAQIGSLLEVHPLILEDVVNTHQRPKAEVYDGYLFVVLKMLRYGPEGLDTEQVSVILGRGCVITFQEKPGDVFDPVRQRIRSGKGRLRRSGADYLAYALLDVVVDNYFLALEGLGQEIEDLEEELIADPGPEALQQIHTLKRVMIGLRKAVWPLRELVLALERSETELIDPATEPYLRDVYDHSIQVIDTVETYRDTLSGYLDIYLSSVSNRMNEVMKVLTIIATIFIPITFLVGVYGMNFEYMPELRVRWAYPALWGVMLAIGGGLLIFFRRKRWL